MTILKMSPLQVLAGMRRMCALVCAVLGGTSLLAQSYAFEVASIKPAKPDNPPGQGVSRAPGGRFNAVNAPLRFLILYAYQIQGDQLIGAPEWIANERFDIVAKMEGDPPSIVTAGPDPMRLATRTLLADRFGLVVRRETRELEMYALTMAKPAAQPGRALKRTPDDCSVTAARARAAAPAPSADGTPPFICGQSLGPGRIRFGGYPLSLFANGLSQIVGRTVVDRTGLTGNWPSSSPMRPKLLQTPTHQAYSLRFKSSLDSSSNRRQVLWRCWSSTACSDLLLIRHVTATHCCASRTATRS